MNETFGMIANEVEETQLTKQQTDTVSAAHSIVVLDKPSYDFAMDFLKNIKSVAKQIESYWSEPKRKANEAWKSICSKEKEMLSPLSDAESIVKKKMQSYADEQRRIEQEIQRQQAEARQIESDRLMKEAAEAEKSGNQFQAEINLSMAQSLETPSNFTGNTKQSGTRENKVLKVVAEDKVPAYVNGICIRPVDMVAVKRLYQLTGKIPDGIIMTTEISIVAR